MTAAERVRERIVGLFFPRRCPVCGEIVRSGDQLICEDCVKKLSPVRAPVCRRCGKEVESDRMEYCHDCMRHPRSFRHNFALLNYNGTARQSLAAVKYKNKREYLDFYARAICVRFGRQILRVHPDVIVPVPIHPSRRRSRGFNQAELLARLIGSQLGIPVCPDALTRVRKTLPQKQLDPGERLHNLERAFAVGSLPDHVHTVLLADDIYTTGSTIEACTRVLLANGVKQVYSLTVCIGKMT